MTSGYHEVTYDDKDTYRGQWNADGKRHGVGVLNFADGTVYAGEFQNGMNHGHGVLTFRDKSVYSGEFDDGKYHGYGVFVKGDGTKYEGEFNNGKVEGHGKITFADGSSGRPRQEGTFGDRKLTTGGKQQTAINMAKEAKGTAEAKAKEAGNCK